MRRVILAIVSTAAALVLLLSFKTHNATSLASPPAAVASTTPSATPTTPAAPSVAEPSTAPTAAASSAAPATSAPAAAATTTKAKTSTKATTTTVTGDAVDTRYGPVQVEITVTSGKLTAVNVLQYPQNERRDQEINDYALPVLDKEALAAGTAKIDVVSGATYTSDGYVNSLQSALDKAGL